jgi:hypothetical protein
MGLAVLPSKIAAVTASLHLICPRRISILQVDRFIIAVKFDCGRALLLGSETGILGPAER